MTNLDSIFKSRDITLPTKVHLVKAMVFPAVMYGCESWTAKKAEHQRIDAFDTVVLEKTLESPLDCKEIQPVHSEGDQPWDFFGRNDAKAETPVFWPPYVKSWLTGKDSDARRDWGQEEKGTTEDEMARWHHWLDRRESEWTLGVGDGLGGLACCDSWGPKELDMTEWLNWTEAFDCVDHNKLWHILHETGILDHLTCLLSNLNAGQEATVRTRHGTTDRFQIRKGVHQGCILSPCLFNLYAECIMRWSISWNQDCREKYQ